MVQRAVMSPSDPRFSNNLHANGDAKPGGNPVQNGHVTGSDSRETDSSMSEPGARYPGWLRIAIIAGGAVLCWIAALAIGTAFV